MIFTIFLAFIVTLVATKTPGCEQTLSTVSSATHHNITIHDPATGEVMTRQYRVNLPSNYSKNKEYPVIFWFHGWGGDSVRTLFQNVTDTISIYPLGMDDEDGVKPGDGRISWNVGDANHTNTCSP